MGKSYRKTKIFGNCGASEKQGKRFSNRIFRRKEKRLLKKEDFENILLPVHKYEGLPSYDLGKDGKYYWKNATKKNMRK